MVKVVWSKGGALESVTGDLEEIHWRRTRT